MLERYVHLGYPKCASTSLQFDYFATHPQIRHLGKGCNGDQVGYSSSKIKEFMEIGVRFKNSFDFRLEDYRRAFEEEFEMAARQPGITATGISSENLSISYADDIDIAEKADRLFDLFGPGTKILFIIRNQQALISSLFKESIRQGSKFTFRDYLRLTSHHRYKSWFFELDPWRIFNLFAERFGGEHICVIPFEKLVADQLPALAEISNFIGVSPPEQTFADSNRQFSDETLYAKWLLNQRVYYGLQRPINEPPHSFKFDLDLQGEDPWKTQLEARIEQELILALNRLASTLSGAIDLPPIDTNWPAGYLEIYRENYAPGNAALNDKLGLGLERYGYWL